MRVVSAIIFTAVAILNAADASFFGTWIFVPAKSSLIVPDITFTELGPDQWRQTDQDGKAFTFKMDGQKYPDAYGAYVSAKKIDATTWQVTNYVDGKPASVDTMKLSADGKTLADTNRITVGKQLESSVLWHRVGSGAGFAGTWKGDPMAMPPFTLEVLPTGSDGLIFRVGDIVSVDAKFDGKFYPVTGSQVPKGSTASFTRQSATAFHTIQKFPDGTTSLDAVVSVSNDGNTLTESGQAGTAK